MIFALFCNVFDDVLTLFQSFQQMCDWHSCYVARDAIEWFFQKKAPLTIPILGFYPTYMTNIT